MRHSGFRHLFTVLFATTMLAAAGCDDGTSSGDPDAMGDTMGTPMASQAEISSCKESCNQLKFFDCNDALEQAACFANCESADSSGIELFNACVRNDICDPDCATNIEPPTPPVTPPASDCTTLCGDFATECLGGDSSFCAATCAEDAGLASYCLSRRNACELPAECTDGGTVGPEDPAESCKDACQAQGFFGCIQPTDVATCQGLCDSADDTTRDGFTACVQTSTSCSGCFEQLGGTTSVNVSGCQDACDQLAFFDCVDAGTQATCRNTCASSTDASAVDNFIACTEGICSDDSCLDVLSPVTQPDCTADTDCGSGEVCTAGECVASTPECTADTDCGSGEVCDAGTCVPEAPECTADTDCASGEVCDGGVCVTEQTGSCPGTPCGASEICQDGQCVARPASCNVTLNGSDGCDHDEICLFDENDNTYCYQARACDAGDSCTPDNLEAGAVCSTGLINGKSAICIPDSCVTDSDCITNYNCADVDGLNFGICTSGTEFDYCYDSSDCINGLTCNTGFGYCE